MQRLIIFLLLALSVTVGTAEPVRVGAILPLSGAIAEWGTKVRIGLETADKLQGNSFSFIFEDEGNCEAQRALTAYRKLVSIDKAQIIFLGCLAGTEAITPVAAKDNVLLLSLGLLNERVLESRSMLVNMATGIGTEGSFLVRYLLKENPSNIAGIFFSDAFGQEFARVVEESLKSEGKQLIARDAADAGFQSFKSQIMRWKRLKVDLLVTTLSESQQLTLLKEMSELKFTPKVYSSYVLESLVPAPTDRHLLEDIKYTHPINSAEQSANSAKVNAELKMRDPRGQSNVNALFAYDGIKFLSDAISHCSGSNPKCLYTYFTGLGAQTGVSGDMRFEKNGGMTRPYGLKSVKEGKFLWLEQNVEFTIATR